MSLLMPSETQVVWQEEEPGIRHYAEVISRRRRLVLTCAAVVFAIGLALILGSRPVYRATAKLLVQPPSLPKSSSVADVTNPLAAVLAAVQPASVGAQADEMRSATHIQEAVRAAGVPAGPSVKPPSVRVEAPDLADVISVRVEDRTPAHATRIANSIMDLHLARLEKSQTDGLDAAIGFLQQERDVAHRRLDRAANALARFMKGHRVAQLTTDQAAEQSLTLYTRMEEAKSNLRMARAQVANLQSQVRREPLDVAERRVRDNPLRPQLEERHRQLKIQRLELLKDFQPTSIAVKELDEQIASFEERLKKEPAAVRQMSYLPNPRRSTLDTQIAELSVALRNYQEAYSSALGEYQARRGQQGSLQDVGPREVRLQGLTEERAHAQARLNLLSDRLQDLQIRRNAHSPLARVIERAGPAESASWPPRGLALALCASMALLVGVGAAFLHDALDDRVRYADDLQQRLALPTIGHVPAMGQDGMLPTHAMQTGGAAAEAYRMLRAGVKFAGHDAPVRRLQITSAAAGEGKTTTAINLATAMALDGKRVILVDADLRAPTVGSALKLPDTRGLTDVLAGRASIADVLQATDVENLSVVAAGTAAPNPAELLSSAAFGTVAGQLEAQADVVIFDTPPCASVIDPLVVTGQMDGVILVLQAGKTRAGELEHVVELLDRARARLLGTVFNRVPRGEAPYRRYRGAYGGYGSYGDTTRRTSSTALAPWAGRTAGASLAEAPSNCDSASGRV